MELTAGSVEYGAPAATPAAGAEPEPEPEPSAAKGGDR